MFYPINRKWKKKLNHLWFIAKQCQAWQRTGLKQTNKMTKKSSKQICLCCNKIIEILNNTLIWFVINSSLYIQNKFWVFWHSYVHKCKPGERHTFIYTSARIDITQHSWAGRGFWTTIVTKTERELTGESSCLHTEETQQGLFALQDGSCEDSLTWFYKL